MAEHEGRQDRESALLSADTHLFGFDRRGLPTAC